MYNENDMKIRRDTLLAIGLSVVVFFWFLIVVLPARIITPDSVSYLSTAKIFFLTGALIDLRGGLFVNWPPLIPILYSAAHLFSIDILTWLNLLYSFVAGSISLITFLILRNIIQDYRWALVGAVILVIWQPITDIFMLIMSEPIFLALFTLSLLALLKTIDRYSHFWFMVLVLASIGMSLTRYSGLVVILIYTLLLFVYLQYSSQKKMFIGFAYPILASSLLGGWMLRNLMHGFTPGDRSFQIGLFDYSVYIELPFIFVSNLFYGGKTSILIWFIALSFLIVIAYLLQSRFSQVRLEMKRNMTILGFIATAYILLLGIILNYIDKGVLMDNRQLIHILYVIFILLFGSIFWVWKLFKNNLFFKKTAIVVVIIIFIINLIGYAKSIYKFRLDFIQQENAAQRLNSLVNKYSDQVGNGSLIYSDIPDYIYYATDMKVNRTPMKYSASRLHNMKFNEEFINMFEALKDGSIAIIMKEPFRHFLYNYNDFIIDTSTELQYEDQIYAVFGWKEK